MCSRSQHCTALMLSIIALANFSTLRCVSKTLSRSRSHTRSHTRQLPRFRSANRALASFSDSSSCVDSGNRSNRCSFSSDSGSFLFTSLNPDSSTLQAVKISYEIINEGKSKIFTDNFWVLMIIFYFFDSSHQPLAHAFHQIHCMDCARRIAYGEVSKKTGSYNAIRLRKYVTVHRSYSSRRRCA